jgi:hypothetical protein
MPDEQRVLIFDPAVLLDAEAEVIARTARGEVAVLEDRPVLRAAFLRHLLLGLPAPCDVWPIRLPGVRIRGACIDGLLDLADCAGPSATGLPALALEACDIAEPIELTNARLVRLSLRDSRIGEIRARGLRIDGSLDISGVAPLAETAWIDAHAAVIEGDLLARGASLRIPPPRPGVAHRDARYALRLSGAEVRGSLDLMGEFTAIGGVALDTAHVTGDVVARGARIGAGEGDAVGAQAARFDGVVIFGDGFIAAGIIWLMGARIAGTLDMNGARLVHRAEDGSAVVLAVDTAEIGGSMLLRNGFTAEGAVSLRGTRIGSSLECDGASLVNDTPDGTGIALAADHAVISGAVLLRNGFSAQGAVSLIGTRIGGNLECDGANLSNATNDGIGVALAAENAVIGGAVLLRHGFSAHGGVSLLGATIDSNVECCGASLQNWPEQGSRETLRLTNVEISGDVLLNAGFTSLGYVSLWGTKIGRDLDCSTARFIGPSSAASGRSMAGALVATNLAVAGDVKLVGVTVMGRIDCENLQTGGSLIWDGLRFPREVKLGDERHLYRLGVDALPRVQLSHARIGAALMARDLTAEVGLAIDLGGARAGTLDDTGFPAGWGVGRAGDGLFCTLNLDGFVRALRSPAVGLERDRRRSVSVRPMGGASRPSALSVMGAAAYSPHGARAPCACATALGLGTAAAEGGQRVSSPALSPFGKGTARAGPLSCCARGCHCRAVDDPGNEPDHTVIARRVGGVLRLRPLAGASHGHRCLAAGHRHQRRVVGLETGPRACGQLHLCDDRGQRCSGVPTPAPGRRHRRRPGLRRGRHPATVLCIGHDGPGDGAAPVGQVLGGYAARNHFVARILVRVLLRGQARDVARTAHLFGCTEAEGGGVKRDWHFDPIGKPTSAKRCAECRMAREPLLAKVGNNAGSNANRPIR